MKHKIVIYTSSHLRTTPKTVCIANAISKALGDWDSAENYHEIPIEEYEKRMADDAERV